MFKSLATNCSYSSSPAKRTRRVFCNKIIQNPNIRQTVLAPLKSSMYFLLLYRSKTLSKSPPYRSNTKVKEKIVLNTSCFSRKLSRREEGSKEASNKIIRNRKLSMNEFFTKPTVDIDFTANVRKNNTMNQKGKKSLRIEDVSLDSYGIRMIHPPVST